MWRSCVGRLVVESEGIGVGICGIGEEEVGVLGCVLVVGRGSMVVDGVFGG